MEKGEGNVMTDETIASDIRAYASDLASEYAERDELLRHMEDIYLLKWGEQSKLEQQFAHMYITKSPSGRNAIKAALRLMTATYPKINVPPGMHEDIGQDMADEIEKACSMMLRASDRIVGQPLHMDACLSGLLYDEIHISVNSTSDLVEYARGGSKAQQVRAQRAAAATPFLFRVHNPIGCYADYDHLGLRAWARRVTMSRQEIIETYGSAAGQIIESHGKSMRGGPLDTYDVWTYYDTEWYACWIDGSDEMIHMDRHELPTIPVVVQRVEGSHLFSSVSDRSEPFLFGLWTSGLWNRQNLMLSAQYTNAATALWPQLVYVGPEGTEPYIDLSNPMGIVRVPPGAALDTFKKNLIDPALTQMWALAERLGEESTIYKQVAGGGLGQGETFSAISLLNQAGRLPLISIQRKAGWAMGDMFRVAFAIMRDGGGRYAARADGKYLEIRASDIPEDLEVEVSLDAQLPQDKLQLANIFNMLEGKLPQEWLIENVLGINQPQEIVRQVMTEQATKMQFQMYLQRMAQQAMARDQAQAQMAEQMQMQSPPMAPQANPMMGGLPREMLMGGAQGPRRPPGEEGGGMYESEFAGV
jgi:hypothetical protein